MITNRRHTQTPFALRSRFAEPIAPPPTEGPAYVRKASAASSSAVTGITAGFSTPTPTGRLLTAIATSDSTLASAWVTPSGWTRGPEAAIAATPELGTVLFYKIATASEPLSYTFDTGATASYKLVTILEFTGNLTSAVFDAQAVATDAGSAVLSLASGSTATLSQADEIVVAVASVRGLPPTGGGYSDGYSDDYAFYSDVGAGYGATYTSTYTGTTSSTGPTWSPWTNSYESVSIQTAGTDILVSHNVAFRIVSAITAQSTTASWTPSHRAVLALGTFKAAVSTSRSGSVTISGTDDFTLQGSRTGGSGGVVLVSESGGIQGTGMAVSSTIVQASVVGITASGSSVKATWPQATTPNNLLLAFLVATPNSGFAGPANWVPLTQAVQTGLAGQIFYIPNAGSRSGDETFNLGSVSSASLVLMEVRGILTTSPLDVQATSSGTSNLAATGQTAETAQDDEFWVGLVGVNGNSTFDNESNGFNLFRTSTGSQVSMAVLDSPVASAGLASTSVALQSSRPWVGTVATFKANSLDIGGGTFSGRAEMVMGAVGKGVLKAKGSGRADIVIGARGGAQVTVPPAPGGPPVVPPPDAYDVVRKETEELAILLSEPRVTYDFDSVRNVVEVLGAKPESGLKRVRYVAVAPRNHPLSPHNLARNGEPRYLIEVIETGLAIHRRQKPGWWGPKTSTWQRMAWKVAESNRLHGAMVKRKKRAKEIADRRLDEYLRLSVEVETDVLPQPHLELGDLVLLKSKTAGRFEFRYKRGSLPLGSSSGQSIGFNKRLRLLKKKRRK